MSAVPPNRASRVPTSSFILQPSALSLVAIGCLGIAAQVALLRELMAAYGGNELSTGVTVAAWLLAEALGASLAAAAPVRQYAGRLRSVPPLSLLAALSGVFSLVSIPAAIVVRPLLGALPGEVLSIPNLLLGTFIVVFLPATLHGALFVTAAARRGVGSAYVWEGVGTALAGFACFLLLSRLPSLAVVALFSLPLAVAVGFGREQLRMRWTMGILGCGALAAFVFALPVERWAWSMAWHGQRVTAVANSPYGKTILLERGGQQLVVYDGLPVLTAPATSSERVEELSLLPVLCHPSPRRILVLGSDLAISYALARFRPDIEVTAVQIDPVLARAARDALSTDRTIPFPSLTVADPVSFLVATRDTFDCIILTDPAPSSLSSSRLFSAEFYRLCHSRLGPGGIFATAGQGSPTGLSPDVLRILATRERTLEGAFEFVLPVAADFPLLLASDQSLDVSAGTIVSRLARLSARPVVLDSGYVASLLDSFRQRALASALEPGTADRQIESSTAALPRELFLNMVRENRLVSPAFGALYARLGSSSVRRHSSSILVLLGSALLMAGVAGARTRGRRFGRGFAVLTSGFSGAAISSLLLFVWQGRFGSAFSGVSLLVTAFMLGAVLGGILGNSSSAHRLRFFASDLALAACAAGTAGLLGGGAPGLFLLLNCLAGACLGFQFAQAGSIVSASASAARRAGVLTALDLAGGSVGGILTALVVVPVLGIGAAALLAAAVKLASALAQLTPGRPVSQP